MDAISLITFKAQNRSLHRLVDRESHIGEAMKFLIFQKFTWKLYFADLVNRNGRVPFIGLDVFHLDILTLEPHCLEQRVRACSMGDYLPKGDVG